MPSEAPLRAQLAHARRALVGLTPDGGTSFLLAFMPRGAAVGARATRTRTHARSSHTPEARIPVVLPVRTVRTPLKLLHISCVCACAAQAVVLGYLERWLWSYDSRVRANPNPNLERWLWSYDSRVRAPSSASRDGVTRIVR